MSASSSISICEAPATGKISRTNQATAPGMLIVNADDWGRDRITTQRIFDCVKRETVTAASAMVFMDDSERAAELARERGLDAGLHLNFTTPFTATNISSRLAEKQCRIGAYLKLHPLARVLYNPLLASDFAFVVASQLEEFQRLYGRAPGRIDGHHHMHLCRNVLAANLLPEGMLARRNFSFPPGEKSAVNRWYRSSIDRQLARRHRLTDLFFSIAPLAPRSRLTKIVALAQTNVVELETHPVNADEYRFLMGDEAVRWSESVRLGSFAEWREELRADSQPSAS